MSAPARLAPGDVIDGIRLGEPISGGTMARVFRASRADLDFPLVVKVPRLGQGEPGASVVSYEVEQQTLAALSGPHVPRFVSCGTLDHAPYIAMERIDGASLEERARDAPLAPAEVARIGAAIANAVHALHLQDVIHLDLKPSNVLLRDSRGGEAGSLEAVLLDFGLSHHARLPDLLAEEFRRPIGTAPYISPEQVLGVRNDPRSDLFAIGVILYQLATGRLPYGAPDSPRGMRARLHAQPEAPRRIVPGIPEWLQEVILACLEPDAARRPPSAARLAFDLAHPETVQVTARGRRTHGPGWRARLARWLAAAGYEPAPPATPSVQGTLAPILLVAVGDPDLAGERARAMAATVRRALAAMPEARLVCATVMKPVPEWGTSDPHQTPAREHLRHRIALQHWVATEGLPAGHVTFHVLESADPVAALVEYMRANPVDQVIVGEPPPAEGSAARQRAWAASVGGRLAAEAPCTVTVVRARRAAAAD